MTKTNYRILSDCRGMYEDEVFDVILSQRGIKNVKHFLNPTENDLLSIDSLLYIDEAYRRVDRAITNN